ncbi:MAG: recombination protein RecR, partial [Duncaniella sp.]|nr:recombination protein RecR [Duncaniella sp.]
MSQEFASHLLEDAVSQLSRLPGIGRKTALRLALHILRADGSVGERLGQSIIDMRKGVRYCRCCHNISETEICPICADPRRDARTICVVETVKDVMSFENTGQYAG